MAACSTSGLAVTGFRGAGAAPAIKPCRTKKSRGNLRKSARRASRKWRGRHCGAFGEPEPGPSRLLGVDDAAADGAGAGEQLLKLVALAPTDRPLERGQVLVEPAEHFQHCLAVVEEDVAPHH